jgi:hypothetical protein
MDLKFKFTLITDDGWEEDCEVPGKYVVCSRCQGRGRIVNPAVDGNGLSREDFDADPDFEEAYFSGVYDIDCPNCDGLRVVMIPDESDLSEVEEENLARYRRAQEEVAESRHIQEMERRMGA